MAGSVLAPVGGIMGDLGGESRPMILTLAEVERFEEQYSPIGIFDVLGRILDPKSSPQVRHCRDIVILGLIGGGMDPKAANDLVMKQPLAQSLVVRNLAQQLLFAAFIPPTEDDDDTPPAGGGVVKGQKADTTSPKESATS